MMPAIRRRVLLAVLESALCLPVVPAGLMAQTSNVAPPPSAGPFRIAGTVVSAKDGRPLPRARVSILDTTNRQLEQSMITGEDGHFEFEGVRAGKYALQGARRGYLAAGYDAHQQFSTAIVTGAGLDTENLVLRLAPEAVLEGHVVDETGDPVRHATVTLWRDDHSSGVSRIMRARVSSTDDLGAYEFAFLNEGTYFLSASATPWYAVHPRATPQKGAGPSAVDRSLDVAYPVTYYADATEADEATPILIRGGDRLDIDLHLSPVPALHVIFRQEQKQGEVFSPMLAKRVFDGTDATQGVEMMNMVEPGTLEVVTAPGKYTVRIPTGGGGMQTSEIDITQDGQEIAAGSGEQLGSVTAAVKIAGVERLPQPLYIALRDSRNRVVGGQQVDPQGQASFRDLAPGNYQVLAGSPQRAYAVISISSQGAQTSGHVLPVAPGAALTVGLTLAQGLANLEGFVKKSGKGVAGAMVVLVPKNPELNRELFRRDQSDLDGSFRFPSVIAGSYTVIAIENGWDLDWAKPAVLAHYSSHGQPLVVAPSERPIQLPSPVELQPK